MADAAVMQVYLRRPDSSHPWGFRLQGGSDFQTPISIQLVQPNGIADRSGLQAGDYVLRINDMSTSHMSHEQAKMEIIRSANEFAFQIQRGGSGGGCPSVWTPQVNVLPQAQGPRSPQPHPQMHQQSHPQPHPQMHQQAHPHPQMHQQAGPHSPPMVTATSLHARPQSEQAPIGQSHNRSAAPFGVPDTVLPSDDGRVRKVVHSQFNSPLGLYSDANVSNTYSDRMQEAKQTMPGGFRSVKAPTGPPAGSRPVGQQPAMYCGACGEFIKGVFVKVQGRIPMHPDCLKCTKCGVGLRNAGYFYINDKLYCETHAKQVDRPGYGMEAVTVYK